VAEVRAAVADVAATDEDAVVLEVLSPDEEVIDRIRLRLDVLKDLDALYKRLPDGKYRLFLRRDGREIPIFREVLAIRGGRVMDPTRPEDTQDKPPGSRVSGQPKTEMSLNLSPVEIERLWQRLLAGQALPDGAPPAEAGDEVIEPPEAESGTRRPRVHDAAREPRALRGTVDKTAAARESEQTGEKVQAAGQPLAGAAAVLGLAAAMSNEQSSRLPTAASEDGKPGRLASFWRRVRRWLRRG
jgi:hypothetical protein